VWKSAPNNIINNKSNCPQCSNRITASNEEIDQALLGRTFKRISNYLNNHTKIKFQCLLDNFIWETTSKSILLLHSGCPKCAKVNKLTNEDVDLKLKNKNILRLQDVINSATKISVQCLTCSFIWNSSPHNLLTKNRGCPKCNLPGSNEKSILTMLDSYCVSYMSQYNIRHIDSGAPNYRIDIFIPGKNLAIEYHGRQHYQPTGFGSNNPQLCFTKQVQRDSYLRQFCQKNNISLLEIDGRKYYGVKLKSYVINQIIPLLN
jgi:hypothetical protein